MTDEDIVMPRLVNQQSLDFNGLCEYLADGSTVTAADVAAVMKQIEMRLPLVLGLNAKVVCSPEGLTFRPKVSGSLTQSQLKAKLEAKLAADPTLEIDVNRALTVSDLTVNDISAEIAIELPKKWTERFQSKAEFKRVNKVTAETAETTDGEEPTTPTDNNSGTTPTGGDNNGNGDNGGGGDDNGGDNHNPIDTGD